MPINAYNQCVQRMTGAQTQLVPNSLKLSLGCIPSVSTSTPIPQPNNYAQVPTLLAQNSCYLGYVDQPYVTASGQKMDFVFAATQADVILVDFKNYIDSSTFNPPGTGTVNGLPWLIPSIVMCQADQQSKDVDVHGKSVTRIIHAKACAEPMNNLDRRPHPGALTFTFQDGMLLPYIQKPLDLFNGTINNQIPNSPCQFLFTFAAGDYPDVPAPNPYVSNNDSFPAFYYPAQLHHWYGKPGSVALYDWVRRGGAQVNVQALNDMLTTTFNTTDTGSCIHAYEVFPPNSTNSQGGITYTVLHLPNNVTSFRSSQDQWEAIAPGNLFAQSQLI